MISIIVLTYNRPECILHQLAELLKLDDNDFEIIIVDNCSEIPVSEYIPNKENVLVIRNEENMGAVGRNKGMLIARGDIFLTLDDDVYGITDLHLKNIRKIFERQQVAALNFRVEEEGTGRITDWCHPCDPLYGADLELETNDISEGAVALRRVALEQVGYYPESFFISHEGPDLAFRLINKGWQVIYSPAVVVIHGYDIVARASWRRYYYDTRNQLWFVLRNLTFVYGVKRLLIGWGGMLIYSLRDGYFKYWLRAVWDSVLGARNAWKDRSPPTLEASRHWRLIERNKPSFWSMVRKRMKGKGVKI